MADPLATLREQIVASANKPPYAADNETHSASLCLGCVLDLIDKARASGVRGPEDGLREALERADRWVLSHRGKEHDWACPRCHPTDFLGRGDFSCSIHEAEDRAALRSTPAAPAEPCKYDPAYFDRCVTHGGHIGPARDRCDLAALRAAPAPKPDTALTPCPACGKRDVQPLVCETCGHRWHP